MYNVQVETFFQSEEAERRIKFESTDSNSCEINYTYSNISHNSSSSKHSAVSDTKETERKKWGQLKYKHKIELSKEGKGKMKRGRINENWRKFMTRNSTMPNIPIRHILKFIEVGMGEGGGGEGRLDIWCLTTLRYFLVIDEVSDWAVTGWGWHWLEPTNGTSFDYSSRLSSIRNNSIIVNFDYSINVNFNDSISIDFVTRSTSYSTNR